MIADPNWWFMKKIIMCGDNFIERKWYGWRVILDFEPRFVEFNYVLADVHYARISLTHNNREHNNNNNNNNNNNKAMVFYEEQNIPCITYISWI
jgi:hypothetical protein